MLPQHIHPAKASWRAAVLVTAINETRQPIAVQEDTAAVLSSTTKQRERVKHETEDDLQHDAAEEMPSPRITRATGRLPTASYSSPGQLGKRRFFEDRILLPVD